MNEDKLIAALREYGADMDRAMERFIDDKELYCTCLGIFMEDNNFAVLDEQLRAGDYKQAFNAAHALKGVAANLGLTPVYTSICVLVESLRAESYGGLDEEYRGFVAQHTLLEEVIHAAQ